MYKRQEHEQAIQYIGIKVEASLLQPVPTAGDIHDPIRKPDISKRRKEGRQMTAEEQDRVDAVIEQDQDSVCLLYTSYLLLLVLHALY